ncbi:WXG100 family type VII secretion target [Kitasatospora sp. NPDC050543]|uniref:WXG100 family type VII secretion target n=1 Tax=Kitasatospora sp. NPDC050543 TaxID=3364054 RepID=UPI0037A3E1D8
MALTSVEIQGMTTAQSAFQHALDEGSGAYAQMASQIETLQGSWSGDAAKIYTQAMHDWLTDFQKVNQALATMLENLSSNTKVYANTHEDTNRAAGDLAKIMGSGVSGLPGFPT